MEENEWEKVITEVPPTWDPKNEGDFIQGKLIIKKKDIGKHKAMCYIMETEGSNKLGVYGSTVLDEIMLSIDEGQSIKIVYKGIEEGKKYKNYEVFRKKLS